MKPLSLIRNLWLLLLAVWLSGCGAIQSLILPPMKVQILYGSEKKEWLDPLVAQYNAEKHQAASGAVIEIEAIPMGSIEAVQGIIDGTFQPTVWSPASSASIPLANAEWRKRHNEDLVDGTPKDLVLSPVVIAIWQPMAEALGWPQKALGWADIAQIATSPEGWSAYGYPEWGNFKFGHTHPGYSNSGLAAILAEAYAGTGKQRGLTAQDLQSAELKAFMAHVESSIIHYGTSTGFFAERMFERGPSYLSAAVLYENLVVVQESKRLTGQSSQLPVVAIYPKEGTFWSNHPYAVLNAPWVTEEQQTAAEDFQSFLLERPQQLKAMELGFRPADPSIPLSAPLDRAHGIDPTQPQTILQLPEASVIDAVQSFWEETKKPVDLVVVMDISGSMSGEKISAARQSLIEFIRLLDNQDRLEILIFSDQITELSPLTPLGEKREDLTRRVSGIIEGGDTRLYDVAQKAYQDLEANGDPSHIRGVVLLTDGDDTASTLSLDDLMETIGMHSEGGDSIKMFTIAFGEDADRGVLQKIAESTGAKQYDSDPQTINKIYAEIATFF